MDQGQRVVAAPERLGDLLRRMRLAPSDVQPIGDKTVGQGDLVPALGEGAAYAHQQTMGDGVAHGRLLQAAARRGRDVDAVIRL